MRIDAFNKVSQLYKANSSKSIAKSKEGSFQDKLEISQTGKDYQMAKQIVAQAPEIREDKINAIKQRLEAGTYSISNQELAEKLVEKIFN